MGASGSCCEGREDKQNRPKETLHKRRFENINEEVDNVLDNFAEFMRQKHRLQQQSKMQFTEGMTLRPGTATLTGDQGGTIEGSGNLSVSGIPGGSLAKHLKTLIKMQNVGSYSDKSYVVPSIFFTTPPLHHNSIVIFKSLSNLMNFTFKKEPSPKISHFFKIRKFRYPPEKLGAKSHAQYFKNNFKPRFSYENQESNFYADKFADFLREQRAEGLEFIGGTSFYNQETELHEVDGCFYSPTTKPYPFFVQAISPQITLENLQELLNMRLRQQNMLFRCSLSLFTEDGDVKQHLIVYESRDMPLYNFDFHVAYFPQEHWCEGGLLDQSQLATHLIKEEVINCSTLSGALINKSFASSFLIFAI